MLSIKIKIIAIIVFLLLPINTLKADINALEKTATLELALDKESFFTPNLELNIVIRPGGQSINAAAVNISFDPAALELISLQPNINLDLLIATSGMDNLLGQANIICGTTTPLLAEQITIAKLTFKKLGTGFTRLTFSDNSQVTAANGLGTNILFSAEVHNIYIIK